MQYLNSATAALFAVPVGELFSVRLTWVDLLVELWCKVDITNTVPKGEHCGTLCLNSLKEGKESVVQSNKSYWTAQSAIANNASLQTMEPTSSYQPQSFKCDSEV